MYLPKEEVFKILTSDTEDFTFGKEFYGTKLASKSKYVSDYQNYGDRFSNEILEKLRQAEQELMNKYYLKNCTKSTKRVS